MKHLLSILMQKQTGVPAFLVLAITFSATAQSEIQLGLKASPTVTLNRYTSNTDSLEFRNDRDDTRFTFGLFLDIPFAERYFFSTGIMYSVRKVTFEVVNTNTSNIVAEQYSLEYLEIPLTIKLFTNDIGVDSRIYFQTGFTIDFLVNWRPINQSYDQVQDLNVFDASFYVGGGFDKKLGVTNAFFVGIFFQRGLVDVANNTPAVTLKNDVLGLDLGFRF